MYNNYEMEKKMIKTEEQGTFGQGAIMAVNNTNQEINELKRLKEKYQSSGEKIYVITNSISIDDDTDESFTFLFRRPKPISYDRYLKMAATSASKASKAFINDSIVEEMKDQIHETLAEYPAMAISFTEKLMKMLGLADSTSVKKL